jgi:hypothetical protein
MTITNISKVCDGDGNLINVESSTGNLQIIDALHHEIHAGKFYSICNKGTFGNGDQQAITLTASDANLRGHFFWDIRGSAEGNIAFYEVAVGSGGGALSAMNHSRNSTNTTFITAIGSRTLTTTGTGLTFSNFGAGQIAGGQVQGMGEFILKNATTYAFVIESNAADNLISYNLCWYEV